MKYIWVIEMLSDSPWQRPTWEPCAEAALNKRDAEAVRARWKSNNPSDRFRITKYVPQRGRKRT